MRLTCSFLVILLAGNLSAQVAFNDYFTNKSLRIDYYLSGDASQTVVSLAQLKKEPYWAGNFKNLIDPLNYPYIDCRMNTNEASGFCPVCQRAISFLLFSFIIFLAEFSFKQKIPDQTYTSEKKDH